MMNKLGWQMGICSVRRCRALLGRKASAFSEMSFLFVVLAGPQDPVVSCDRVSPELCWWLLLWSRAGAHAADSPELG